MCQSLLDSIDLGREAARRPLRNPMDTATFALVAAFLLAFGLISGRLAKTVITPPMVFVTFGLLVGLVFLGVIHLDIDAPVVHTLAEATLVLVLFTDALRIDFNVLRKHYHLPLRLLAIGMPLTIVLGALAAGVLFGVLRFWEAAVVGAILAPTDATLGQAVVASKQVPVRIRQALNVESGLNDGIALPVVMVLASLASATGPSESLTFWVRYAAMQVILGPLAGIAIGYWGGKLVVRCSRSGWMDHTFQQLSALALSFLAFAGAELLGGNGFIAAFTAGLTLGNCARQICGCLFEFAEAEGQFLTLLAFLAFGAADTWPTLPDLDGTLILYAVLSLTVIRMLPVALSMIGAGLDRNTILFVGWFGPRGIASLLYVMIVVTSLGFAGYEKMLGIITLTILLSVFCHGMSAVPLTNIYVASLKEK